MRNRGLAAIVAAVGLVSLAPETAHAQVELPPPVYQVSMDASYNPSNRQVKGTERIRWRNTSSVPVNELQFHLYLNAFANNRSTFMNESGGQLRGLKMSRDKWGWIEVDSMRLAYSADFVAAGVLPDVAAVADGAVAFPPLIPGELTSIHFEDRPDLKEVEEFIRPDDGNLQDRTVARYPLPRPLPPGEWVELEIDFSAQLPEIFARTGAHGEYVLGGQWFPKIGVFEDAGKRGRGEAGWNTHQYHAHSEFFADFGDWEVRLTLPARYAGRVGATGRLVNEEVTADTVTMQFEQNGVHDFAWTADSGFIVVEDRFDPDSDVSPEQTARIAETLGIRPEALRLQGVDIRLMLQPAHRSQARRYMGAAKAAIRGFGLRLGAYPYATLTMVDPPRGGMGSGGMEYPTFITLGTHPMMEIPGLTWIRMPEAVAVHEFGHNFFQGMIASNEFEEAWIDEGMTTFYEAVVMEEHYGAIVELFGLRLEPMEENRLQLGAGHYTDAIVQSSWSYRSGDSYGLNSYARPAVTLRHLEHLLGEQTFNRAMRRFFQTWRFRHPSTADFEQIMREEAGSDISWFLHQALHTSRALDYRIGSATSIRHKQDEGWSWEEDGTKTLRDNDEDSGNDNPEDNDELYRSEVVVERWGDFVHPVTVELVYEDGEKIRHHWDGQDRWVRYREIRPAKLVSAEVDPDHLLILDVDRLNNSRRLEPNRLPAAKMAGHLVFWLQNLFELLSIVG